MALVVPRQCSRRSELYFYKTESDRNSVVSKVSRRMDRTRLEHKISKFTFGEAVDIRFGGGDYFESL